MVTMDNEEDINIGSSNMDVPLSSQRFIVETPLYRAVEHAI